MVVIGAGGNQELEEVSDVFIPLPGGGLVSHILASTTLLQLLAYHTAGALGRDVAQPRHLAKSVTVE